MTDPSRPPGPLRVARVLAGLQAAAGVLGLVLGSIGAMAASSADDTSPFQGIAVVLGRSSQWPASSPWCSWAGHCWCCGVRPRPAG